MAVNDIFRVNVIQSLHGQTIINTLHYRQSTADADEANNASGLANLVATNLVPVMKALQSAELSHTGVTAQKIWPLPVKVGFLNTTGAGPGGVAGDSLPTSVAVVISKTTQFAGRKYRGRAYIAGVPVSHESNSALAAGVIPNWLTLSAEMDNFYFVGTDTWQPTIWHKSTSTFDDVTTCFLKTFLRNQRRRQLGVGQ